MSLSHIGLWSGSMSQSQHYWNAFSLLTHIYSIILHPSACLSLPIPPPSLHLTSCSPKPLLYPIAPLHPSLFPHALTLSFFSPPLSPRFLSIHTTESLLIICDLLKYIHCHSLSLPLSSLPLPPCPVFCSATSSHYSFPLSFSLSLTRSTFSLFCLSVLQDNLRPRPPPPSSFCTAEKSQTRTETLLAGAFCMSLLEEKDETFFAMLQQKLHSSVRQRADNSSRGNLLEESHRVESLSLSWNQMA